MLFHHALPRARIAVLEREAFCVGAVGQDDGMFALFERAENIRAHHEAVVHRDRHIPVDAQAVAGFGSLAHPLIPAIASSTAHTLPVSSSACPVESAAR